MHILTLIIIFVIASIGAACKGDFSGVAVIGKFIGVIALFICIGLLFCYPLLAIQIPQVLQRAVQKRRIIIIHMMMDMKQFMMMEIMMITDMTGIQTTQMELMMQWMNWDGKIVVWRYGLFMYISCKMMS